MIAAVFNSDARFILASLATFPRRMQEALAAGMDWENENTKSHLKAARLVGKGPFPVDAHRLGEVSSHLRDSVSRTNAVVTDTVVSSTIGSPLNYAYIHEFGAHYTRQLRERKRSVTQKWKFGRKTIERTVERIGFVKKHDVVIPARGTFQAGIMDRKENYSKTLSLAVVNSWGKH